MTAPLKTLETHTDAVMPEIGRKAREAARVLALRRAPRRTTRSPPWRRRSVPGRSEILAANAEDIDRGQGGGRDRRPSSTGSRSTTSASPPWRRARGRARSLRPGRQGDGELDAAERHDHRARARAARRRRHHLREPARTSPPTPARSASRPAMPRSCAAAPRATAPTAPSTRRSSQGLAAGRAAGRPRSNSCRRATAPRSG